MSKNIIVTEQQLKYLFKGGIMEAFAKMGSKGRTSAATKLSEVCSDNELLRKKGLSLFKDSALTELPEVISACATNPKLLNVVLDDEDGDIFTDSAARDFVLYRVKGIRFNGENRYAEALSEIKKGEMVQKAKEREDRAEANMSTGQQIIKRRTEAKNQRTDQAVNSINNGLETDNEMTSEAIETIKSVCQAVSSKMRMKFAFKAPTVYIPANSKAKMAQNGGIIYGEGQQAEMVKSQVSQIVRGLKAKGFNVSLPRMTQMKVKSGEKVMFIFFNVLTGNINEEISVNTAKHEDARTHTTQADFPETMKCPYCGADARFIFTVADEGGKGEQIGDVDENGNWKETEFQAFATYKCPKCFKSCSMNNMA